jgi:hypothetical protein
VVHAASTESIAHKEARRVYDYYGIRKPRNNPPVSVERIAQLINRLACAAITKHKTTQTHGSVVTCVFERAAHLLYSPLGDFLSVPGVNFCKPTNRAQR